MYLRIVLKYHEFTQVNTVMHLFFSHFVLQYLARKRWMNVLSIGSYFCWSSWVNGQLLTHESHNCAVSVYRVPQLCRISVPGIQAIGLGLSFNKSLGLQTWLKYVQCELRQPLVFCRGVVCVILRADIGCDKFDWKKERHLYGRLGLWNC